MAVFSALSVMGVLLFGWSIASLGLFAPTRTAQTAAAAGSQTTTTEQTTSGTSVDTTIQDIQKAYEAEVQKLKQIQQGTGR